MGQDEQKARKNYFTERESFMRRGAAQAQAQVCCEVKFAQVPLNLTRADCLHLID